MGRIVVLVDENTASRAEFFTMALQGISSTVVVGSQTAGADGNLSTIRLPGGIVAGLSGIGVYYPDGRATQRDGIALDLEVRPTVAGIRAGHDEVLDSALALIGRGNPGR
jgi:C-terminal processing protease CtpA/Prc